MRSSPRPDATHSTWRDAQPITAGSGAGSPGWSAGDRSGAPSAPRSVPSSGRRSGHCSGPRSEPCSGPRSEPAGRRSGPGRGPWSVPGSGPRLPSREDVGQAAGSGTGWNFGTAMALRCEPGGGSTTNASGEAGCSAASGWAARCDPWPAAEACRLAVFRVRGRRTGLSLPCGPRGRTTTLSAGLSVRISAGFRRAVSGRRWTACWPPVRAEPAPSSVPGSASLPGPGPASAPWLPPRCPALRRGLPGNRTSRPPEFPAARPSVPGATGRLPVSAGGLAGGGAAARGRAGAAGRPGTTAGRLGTTDGRLGTTAGRLGTTAGRLGTTAGRPGTTAGMCVVTSEGIAKDGSVAAGSAGYGLLAVPASGRAAASRARSRSTTACGIPRAASAAPTSAGLTAPRASHCRLIKSCIRARKALSSSVPMLLRAATASRLR